MKLKFNTGQDMKEFSDKLTAALVGKFSIDEYVWDMGTYSPKDPTLEEISDFIQQFIGDNL